MSRGEQRPPVLDRVVRPTVAVGRRSVSAFTVCGSAGLALAWVLALTLVARRGLPLWPMAAVAVAAMAAFLALALATKIVTGRETLVYYQHEIAVVAVAALLLWLLGRPVLPYLDATILGVGAFLACGRVGCLMVGCCHGRPARWGVRYRAEHAEAGFPRCYVGVRLVPVQAAESLWVGAVVAIGAAMVVAGREPGAAFAWYVVAYDLGRFAIEFVRGDVARPYRCGFSTAQWLSLLLTWLVVGAGWAGVLPGRSWHLGAAVGLSLTMAAVAADRRWRHPLRYRLLHPKHVAEIAVAVAAAVRTEPIGHAPVATPSAVDVRVTSLGVRVSGGVIDRGGSRVEHYALSSPGGDLDAGAAGALASLVLRLRGADGSCTLVEGRRGVFHLLVAPAGADQPTNGDR